MATYGLAGLPEQFNDPLHNHHQYQTLAFLGKGAFGQVVRVQDRRNGHELAVKIIKGEHVTKYVEYELVNHSMLRHPHIIQFSQVFVWGHNICVVMEYAAGGTLLKYVQKNQRLKESIARWFFQQLMVGVEYCHERGIANRDLKLDNILLQVFEDLPLPVVKICDFGLSKSDVKSNAKSKVGTLAYMAPEVLLSRDSSQYDGKTADIWSCGVMLYVMLYGKYPFGSSHSSGYDIREVVRMVDKMINQSYPRPDDTKVSASCSELLTQMFNPFPNKRITLKEIMAHPWFLSNLPEEAATMNRKFLSVANEVSFKDRTDQIRALISNLPGRSVQLDDPNYHTPPKLIEDNVMDHVILEQVQQRQVSTNLVRYMHELHHLNHDVQPTYAQPTYVQPAYVQPTFVQPSAAHWQ